MPIPKQTPFEVTVAVNVPNMGLRPMHDRCAFYPAHWGPKVIVTDLAPFNNEQTNLNSPQCLFCAKTLGPGKDS